MRDDPLTLRVGPKPERDHMHLLTARDQAARKLPGPVFQAAALRVEALQDQPNSHAQCALRLLFTTGGSLSTLVPVAIHPTAVVSPRAQLAADVKVGPYVIIEDDVKIGAGCEIGAHSVIKRYTTVGERNRVYEHTTLGGEPQDVKFKGEPSCLVIGDENRIRENVTIHRATGEGETTRVGSRNFLMIAVHLAHNCILEDDCIFANGTALAGHIKVEDHVYLSNEVGVHQFVRLGRFAMVGANAKVRQDVLPFFLTEGEPCRVRGLNSVGLRRAGFSAESRLT